MQLFFESAMRAYDPDGSIERPAGLKKLARVPTPSKKSENAAPTKSVTVLVASTILTTRLSA
jgi:hypothetical protein